MSVTDVGFKGSKYQFSSPQRLNEARRMMDKLRACIVANYYANAGQPKVPEVIFCKHIDTVHEKWKM